MNTAGDKMTNEITGNVPAYLRDPRFKRKSYANVAVQPTSEEQLVAEDIALEKIKKLREAKIVSEIKARQASTDLFVNQQPQAQLNLFERQRFEEIELNESETKEFELQPIEEAVETKKPKKKLSQHAQERIESVLNARAFIVVAGVTLFLGLYIYNVISINRLSGETENLRQKLKETKSMNVELTSNLESMQSGARISNEAYQKLGLRFKLERPIEIKLKN